MMIYFPPKFPHIKLLKSNNKHMNYRLDMKQAAHDQPRVQWREAHLRDTQKISAVSVIEDKPEDQTDGSQVKHLKSSSKHFSYTSRSTMGGDRLQ